MISLEAVKRLCLVHEKVDFRKGHDGLLGVSYGLGLKPYEGDLVVFVGRRRDCLKLLLADRSGLWLLYKKFQTANVRRLFRFLNDPKVSTLSAAELAQLIDGAQGALQK